MPKTILGWPENSPVRSATNRKRGSKFFSLRPVRNGVPKTCFKVFAGFLKSGIAPLALLHGAGIRLALGLDSSTLNDDMDMLQEMRLSANLQRTPGVGAATVPLREIFRMGTVNGSNALGWGAVSGSLEPGK